MATYFQQISLVLSLSPDQASMLCLIHELLSNEGQIPGKEELNPTYYLAQIPLLHSAVFTLTLISPRAINEIYHWHQVGRGRKKWQAKTIGRGEWRPSHKEQRA